jgi:hypothetical protein
MISEGSSKRAVGDELTTIFKKHPSELGRHLSAIRDQSALIPRKGGTIKLGRNHCMELAVAEARAQNPLAVNAPTAHP